jgi:4-aminobutyrate aminotransferase-like enzyme
MGNGYPVSAVVRRADVVGALQQHAHYLNTFAGNPVACSAAMAVLDVIDDEDLQNNALEVGNYIKDGLKELAKRHLLIGDLRGSGLFIGIDLVEDRDSRKPATQKAQRAVNLLKDKGVLIGSTGPFDNVLKIRPPIVFSRDNADHLLSRIDEVLSLL